MKSYGYSHGTARVQTFSLNCGRCDTPLESENGSRDLSLGDDFAPYDSGTRIVWTSNVGCTYCGARVNVPAKLVEFLS